MGVVLKGQLEQPTGLLDQQVDLGTGEGTGESPEGAAELRCEEPTSITLALVLSCPSLTSLWSYLIQRDIPDGCAVDLQDAVSNMDGILYVRAHAAWVHSGG